MSQSPQKTTLRIPRLTLHKATGQARVRLQGRDIYLGTYGSEEAEERYRRLIAEWLSGQLPDPRQQPPATAHTESISVNALICRYLQWAKTYYVKGGRLSSGYGDMKDAARALRRHYGRTLVSEFGPMKLKAIREALIAEGLARSTINARIEGHHPLGRSSVASRQASQGKSPEPEHRTHSTSGIQSRPEPDRRTLEMDAGRGDSTRLPQNTRSPVHRLQRVHRHPQSRTSENHPTTLATLRTRPSDRKTPPLNLNLV